MNKQLLLFYSLLFCLVFVGLGGIFGGVMMLIDPSGASMGLLAGLPITSFVLPGLFLLVVMGMVPLTLTVALWVRVLWAWETAVALSITLIGWVSLQLLLWGDPIFIQWLYLGLGVLLPLLSMSPSVRKRSKIAR